MGRKKKTIEQQEKQVNVSTEVKDSQKYNGSVNIRLVKNGVTVQNIVKHNAGNTPLFTFLINCLSGSYNPSSIPSYINLGYYNNSVYRVLTTNIIYKNSSFISVNTTQNVPQINYQFTIPTVLLNTAGFTDSVIINSMKLYNLDNLNTANIENDDNYCAMINLENEIEIPVADIQKYTMFVTWSLYITN